MSLRRKLSRNKKGKVRIQGLNLRDINIVNEAKYIIKSAKQRDGKVVALGPLIFFSTHNGDAWILDIDDNLSLCLCLDGEIQQYRIVESKEKIAIDWNSKFIIENEEFIVLRADNKMSYYFDYPVKEIRKFI